MVTCSTLDARYTGSANNQRTLSVQRCGEFKHMRGDVMQILHDKNHWLASASLQETVYLVQMEHHSKQQSESSYDFV